MVAGPGFAPGSGGYEPPEMLLLHPAIPILYAFFLRKATICTIVDSTYYVGVAQVVRAAHS